MSSALAEIWWQVFLLIRATECSLQSIQTVHTASNPPPLSPSPPTPPTHTIPVHIHPGSTSHTLTLRNSSEREGNNVPFIFEAEGLTRGDGYRSGVGNLAEEGIIDEVGVLLVAELLGQQCRIGCVNAQVELAKPLQQGTLTIGGSVASTY